MLYSYSSQLYEEMDQEIEQIQTSIQKQVEIYAQTIRCVERFVQRLEAFVLEHGFENPDQEMDFFKSIYPRFFCMYTYYYELQAINNLLPVHGTDVMLRDYYLGEYQYQHRFFAQNRTLYDYYLQEESDRDEYYFLTQNYQLLLPREESVSINPHFLTNAGYAFSKFIAFERLQEYVGRKLRLLYRNPESEYVQALLKGSKRRWTGDKIELVEIAYGIYYTRRMNDGKVEVKDIVEWLEDTLGVDLGDAYRIFADLQRRKSSSYTKYLEEMITVIHEHIQEKHRFKASKRKLNNQK